MTPTYDFANRTISNGYGAIVKLDNFTQTVFHAGDTLSLYVSASNEGKEIETNSHHVGIGAVQLHVATLSLLALAALAARRRRKAN